MGNRGKKKKTAKAAKGAPDGEAGAVASGFQPISRRSSADELTGAPPLSSAFPAFLRSRASPSFSIPLSMSVRELKEELKEGGINTAGMLEKEDLISAIAKLRLREQDASPPEASVVPPERSFAEMRRLMSSGTATCDQCGIRAKLQSCVGCFIAAYCSKE
jgi:hypothetical protein